MKQYFLGVVPNYPNSSRYDDDLTITIECSAKDAEKATDALERKLNGGQTHREAFEAAKGSLDAYKAFSGKQWFKVHCQTWAQARDYIGFTKWMNKPITTLPIR